MAVLIFVIALVVAAAWLAFASFIVMLNINDIAGYLVAGQDAPFWPFAWIMLILALTIGGGSRAANN